MPGELDLKELLKKNPAIDPKALERSRELRSLRRKAGARRAGYNLALPFERRRVQAGERSEVDPRTVHLRTSTEPEDQ